MSIKKTLITVEIAVDEDAIVHKYPNYKFNWESVDHFIEDTIDAIETKDYRGAPTSDYFRRWGYSVRVLLDEETKIIDQEYYEYERFVPEAILKHYPHIDPTVGTYCKITCPKCGSTQATFNLALRVYKCFECGLSSKVKGFDAIDELHNKFIESIGTKKL